jgi:hypothetical protein
LAGRIDENKKEACPALIVEKAVGVVGERNPSNILETFSFAGISRSAISNSIIPGMLAILLLLGIVLVLTEGDFLKRGIYFIVGSFIAFFLYGLGLYGAFVFSYFKGVIAMIAILLGLLGVRDYFKGHKPITLKAKYPAGFLLLGFVSTIFVLAQSNEVYMLLKELFVGDLMWKVLPLLFYYSLLVIIPMIALLLIFWFIQMNIDHEKEKQKEKNLKIYSVVVSFIMLLAGVLLLVL